MSRGNYQSQPAAGSPQAAAQLAKLAEAAAEKAKTTAVTEWVHARVAQVITDKSTPASPATTPSVVSNNPGTAATSRLTQLLFNKKMLSLAAIIGGATAYYLYRQRQLAITAAKAKSDEEKAAKTQQDDALLAEYAHIQPSDVPAAPESKGIIATVTSYLPSFSLWNSPATPVVANASTTLRPGQ